MMVRRGEKSPGNPLDSLISMEYTSPTVLFMKTIITYGTFDLFHTGHVNLLKRAKALGDRLIVGVTSDAYDQSRGKLNVMQNCAERIENVRRSGLADLIVVEEEEGQKVLDVQKYGVDVFAIGSDWVGKFDYLKEYCEVVYLERTKGVSSTDLRQEKNEIVRMGIAGAGRIAGRFLYESKYVSGIDVTSVYARKEKRAKEFAEIHELPEYYTDYSEFLNHVDAVYVAVPHHVHYDFVKEALMQGKHVLCEKPIFLTKREAEELFALAEEKNCILQEAIKTAFAPAFLQLVGVAKSGLIGSIRSVDATFTKLETDKTLREYDINQAGGALNELGSYPMLAIIKLLGIQEPEVSFITSKDAASGVDVFTRVNFLYKHATATANAGIGVKKEGDLCIAGTKGYIYVPAPWWKTEYFKLCFEDSRRNRKYFIKFEEDGLRYELSAFLNMIHGGGIVNHMLTPEESIFMAGIFEMFRNGENVRVLS